MSPIRIPEMAPGLLTYRTVRGVKRPTIGALLYGGSVANINTDKEEKEKQNVL
eukprot:TRINITY_DN7600_c0_g1_i1.p3 TRINITY_DN7600_c0_g1~~TRINITY_DN7600_c0_g1_i1.p3  ORF type:complete len:53 (+),score=5.44 TRINITY_DN7600_c0_g1_i1:76-234(+)